MARPLFLGVLMGLAATSSVPAVHSADTCFDFRQKVVQPLTVPIPLVAGVDNHVFGTYPTGIGWASARVVVGMPVEAAYTHLLDHRNVKDMSRMTLSTTVLDRPDYMAFHNVEVVLTLRALFLKLELPWTEQWAFSLIDGSAQAPRRIVVSYQKLAGGTRHVQHVCGSYVLQARDDATTDLSLYEEVRADRRSARDTRDMHRGIVRNLRAPRRSAVRP